MDWVHYLVFGLFTLMVLGGGLMVVSLRNIVQAAGALVLTLFGVAGLYVLLEAGFLAAVQILVYIGAIAILIIFTVMLTRRVADSGEPRFVSQWYLALVPALGVLALLIGTVIAPIWWGATWAVPDLAAGATTRELGLALLDPGRYALPFEIASVLLLGAMVGAIVIAREKSKES